MRKNKYIPHSGIDSKIDSGHIKTRFDQVSQNEMSYQTKKDISILGSRGASSTYGSCPRTVSNNKSIRSNNKAPF